MIFQETPLQGAFLILPESREDDRGFYTRIFCRKEFAAHGLEINFTQAGLSFNRRAGTLRGLHYQVAPFAQSKLLRSSHGAIYDVIVDLRPESPTRHRWFACELSAADRRMLYVPAGFAHGFQTLQPSTEVCYHFGADYVSEAERGVRWNDPAFAIDWPPCALRTMSPRDAAFPDYNPAVETG